MVPHVGYPTVAMPHPGAPSRQEMLSRHWLEDLLARQPIRVALAVALGIALLLRIAHFVAGANGAAWGYDFAAYWLAGQNLLAGEPLYSHGQLIGAYPPQQQFLYLYPPLLATIVAPLAGLFTDYRAAMWLWAGGGAVVTALVTWAIARDAGVQERRAVLLLVAAVFALPLVTFELIMGNVHLLLLGLLGTAWLGLQRQSVRGDLVAGAAISAATLVKIFPVVLLLWVFLSGRWRAGVAALVAGLAMVAVTLPFSGIDAWLDYIRVLANLGPPRDLWSSLAPSSLLAEWIDHGVARVLAASVGLVLVAWAARRKPPATGFALAVTVSLLVVPTLYPHYLALSTLPLLLAALHVRPAVLAVGAWLVLLIGGQLALLDLTDPVIRAAAFLAAVAPLVILLAGQPNLARVPAERAGHLTGG
jgi:hypothetical protein